MSDSPPGVDAGPSHRSVEIGVAVMMLAFAGIVIFGALRAGIGWGAEGPRAGFFPFYVGLIILGASLYNLYQAFLQRSGKEFAAWGQLRQVLSVIVPTAVYVVLIPWLGLYVSSFILIAFFMRWLGRYGWAMAAGVSIVVPVLAFLMFEQWFQVPLPKGPLENMLGF
jgi:putative tricarboxylic transport membrane protein